MELTSYQVTLVFFCTQQQQFVKTSISLNFFYHIGKPVKLRNDPDYVPSVFVYSGKATATTSRNVSRCKRLMQRRERQYAAKRQKGVGAKRKTASVPLITEQTDQPMEMNSAREEEREIENHDRNSSAQVCEQAVSDGDQNGIECEGNNELLQKLEGMEQTILSQQELIANLSFLLMQNSSMLKQVLVLLYRPRCKPLHCKKTLFHNFKLV